MNPDSECMDLLKTNLKFPYDRLKKTILHKTHRNGGDNSRQDNLSRKLKPSHDVRREVPLAGRYVFLRKADGIGLFVCRDLHTKQKVMCRVSRNSCSDILEAHLRVGNHPLINKIQEVVQKGDKTFIFFPMAQEDLLSYIRSKKNVSEREVRHLFIQICIIVKFCHEKGIVLRDLKMRKFVFGDMRLKVLKLELLMDAVILEDPSDDLLREKRGCPVYVAPEILKASETYYGKAADMWSLGVILYTMLIGRYPFNDQQHSGLFAKISRGEFSIPENVSPAARCMIRSLLMQDPQKRLTSEDIFYHPWMKCDIDSEASSNGSSNNSCNNSNTKSNNNLSMDQIVPDIDL